MKRRDLLAASGGLALGLPLGALAQSGGATGRIVVPFAAGGAREAPARAIQQELGTETGQTWIIEAKPGAGGAIGTVSVAKAEPDGRTLLMAASSHFVTAAMGATPNYDPIKDFQVVANLGDQNHLLLVSAEVPARTVAEFIQLAKSKPGQLNYGSAGVGSSTHLAMAYFVKAAGIDVMHVPYKGTAEAVTDVGANRAQAVIVPTAGSAAFRNDPRYRMLGITGRKRNPLLPNVPTIAESGLPGFEFESWYGLIGPAGMPRATVERLNAAVNKVAATKVVQDRLLALGLEPSPMSVDAFNSAFLKDRDLMYRIVNDVGLAKKG
ncbi:MAG: tripartite tricarboxylate transporter substrate-binding protein [Ramlibacter sp.]|jgi:tripartite-type tricarboxylate transporter receptor subunit TctC|uniref:tripartite tricarboxylate transporter substrate-binding protein n=1 Tax=Ramlibacter sp. TaxID=1917967 RepID=UPI002621B3A3|nr:tripartite tricarboxylate transporter substrate-binding protein [Ramlibacter sp.]MDH4376799.1 tripartite tricarboxylate transporter substrate-binding protein [Ramlibacter sp.]